LKFGIMGEFLLRRILAPENDSYFKLADSRSAENTDYALAGLALTIGFAAWSAGRPLG
jgi:hypothetical protein